MLDIRDVKPGASGLLFLVAVKGSDPMVWRAEFWRVRVIQGQVNMADFQKAGERAKELIDAGAAYCAFSAGRNTPLPDSGVDLEDLQKESRRREGLI